MEFVLRKRPRLLADEAKLRSIKLSGRNDPVYAELLRRLCDKCDRIIAGKPAPDYEAKPNDPADGWQRRLGNNMMDFAAAYRYGGGERYLHAAVEWACKSAAYPTWGRGHYANCDIVASHQLFGIAMVYDWLYDQLSEETRQLLKRTLLEKAETMHRAALDSSSFWSREWLQNHMWINMTALLAAALAVYEDAPHADVWIGVAQEKLSRTMEVLGHDGASHEGYMYWEYGLDWLLRYMVLAREHLGLDYFGHLWFKNTARYGLYLLLPDTGDGSPDVFMDLGDCDRTNGLYGSETQEHLLYLLASEYRDGWAQTGAILAARKYPHLNTFASALYYDGLVQPQALDTLPTQGYFPDMGIVSLRSGWGADDSALLFRCGPYIGHRAFDSHREKPYHDWGGGHVHPDVNHFTLFGSGEWLLPDDGYSFKATSNHNTLLINGYGQAGEGWIWFDGRPCHETGGKPHIMHTEFADDCDYAACAGAFAYPAHTGLLRFNRHFLFIKPGVLIVIDDIEADTVSSMELRFIPGGSCIQEDNGAYLINGERSVLRIANTGSEFSLEERGVYRGRQTIPFNTREPSSQVKMLLARTRSTHWLTATVLSWCSAGDQPARPEIRLGQGRVTAIWDSTELQVDLQTCKLQRKDGRK
ncbi:MAG: hypothetical protein K0R57_1348 [Paenibacillaceae bacterium]|jgi:hypothetical protein|nr:hypothetical protein [Paenibacillaceae bacterium]